MKQNTNNNSNTTTATFTTLEEMVATANSNSTFTDVPSAIAKAVETENTAIVSNKAKSLVSVPSVDFWRSMMCATIPTTTKEKDIPTALVNAVSVAVYTIKVNDNGLLELGKAEKAITFKDCYSAKLDLLSFKNADRKPTAEDKRECNKYFFGSLGYGLVQCITASAVSVEQISTFSVVGNADLMKAYSTIAEQYTANGKDNPFDGHSKTKHAEQLRVVLSAFVGEGVFEKKVNAHHYEALFKMLAHFNRKAVFVVEGVVNAMQALIIVARYAHNGVKFTIQDKARIYNK